MSRLQAAIEKGQAQGKLALYFGCWGEPGHYLRQPNGRIIWDIKRDLTDLPWPVAMLDGQLLKNVPRSEIYDGKVFWTVGGLSLWYAFYWWDRSGDRRANSNSGFYVRGFGFPEAQASFDYACTEFPVVVARQEHPLILVSPEAAGRVEGASR